MTHKILFRQSEVSDPYTVYRQQLQEAPICFDTEANARIHDNMLITLK